MIRIILADDHPIVIDGTRRFLELASDFTVVDVASDLASLQAALARSPVDVVVLDLHMPGMRGVETLKDLTCRVGAPAFLVFSMQEEDAYAVSLVQAGAAGFLNKGRDPEELVSAIRAVHQGGRYLSDKLALRLLGNKRDRSALPHETFSVREREVFDLVVRGKVAKDIAKQLTIQVSTVHSYIDRIKVKLDVNHTSEIVSYAFRHRLAE